MAHMQLSLEPQREKSDNFISIFLKQYLQPSVLLHKNNAFQFHSFGEYFFVCVLTQKQVRKRMLEYIKRTWKACKKDKRSYADCVRERIIFPLCFHMYSFFFAILTSYFCCTTTISLPYVVY